MLTRPSMSFFIKRHIWRKLSISCPLNSNMSILISLAVIIAATLNDVYRHAIDERVAFCENAQMFGVIAAMSAGAMFLLLTSLK